MECGETSVSAASAAELIPPRTGCTKNCDLQACESGTSWAAGPRLHNGFKMGLGTVLFEVKDAKGSFINIEFTDFLLWGQEKLLRLGYFLTQFICSLP